MERKYTIHTGSDLQQRGNQNQKPMISSDFKQQQVKTANWAGLEIFFFNFKASNWSDYQWEHRIPVIDIWEVGKYITGLPRHAGQHRKWFVATCRPETIESEWNLVFSSNNRQRKHWWHEKESFLYKILTCGSPFKLCLHREWIAYCALLPCDMTVTSILDSLVVWS